MDDMNRADETVETAIRRYLEYLEDPGSVVDAQRITALEGQLASEPDPLRRLHLHAELEAARQVDAESIRAAFVRHARAYADAHGVPLSAFRAMGVGDIALAEAGFDLGHGTRRAGGARAPRAAAPKGKTAPKEGAVARRKPKVSQAQVRDHVLSLVGTFTLADVMRVLETSPGNVDQAVKALTAEGRVEKLGPVPDHHGRGRAPLQYRVV